MKTPKRFIPAMHFHWLTPLFDRIASLTLPDRELKVQLIEQAGIMPRHTVLDLGCGTATLALLIKQKHADARVIGLDIDPDILKIARRKVADAGVDIDLHQATATRLPYPDAAFDRVLSSFAMHHLTHEDKHRAAAEVFRVLRPGGEFHVLDFGKPHNFYCLLVSCVTRWTEELMENVQGMLPRMFETAGFQDVVAQPPRTTLFGSVSLYRMRKP